MNLHILHQHAPATPPCFADRMQWLAYLQHCNEFAKASADRPFQYGTLTYRPAFNYCSDCTARHADAMAAKGKCKPSMFRGENAAQAA